MQLKNHTRMIRAIKTIAQETNIINKHAPHTYIYVYLRPVNVLIFHALGRSNEERKNKIVYLINYYEVKFLMYGKRLI